MRRNTFACAVVALLTLSVAAVPTSAFGQFSVLYNFGSVAGDGRNPAYSGTIAQGRDGNLYTTTPSGGSTGNGAVVQITPAGTATVLYSFKGTDGSQPSGGLTLGLGNGDPARVHRQGVAAAGLGNETVVVGPECIGFDH